MKKHIVEGVIYTKDRYNIEYPVCHIRQITYENENFIYEFKPYYNVIRLLSPDFFQGIPGINLELEKVIYIRENKTPTFIYERTPQANREDLWKLLDRVGLEYLDRLTWLIRTNTSYTGDSLYVKQYIKPSKKKEIEDIEYQDEITIHSIDDLYSETYQRIKKILEVVVSGAYLQAGKFEVTDKERKNLYELLYPLYSYEYTKRKVAHDKALSKIKIGNEDLGRKRIPILLPKLAEINHLFTMKLISEEVAMKELGIDSRSTFYRRLKELRERENKNNLKTFNQK